MHPLVHTLCIALALAACTRGEEPAAPRLATEALALEAAEGSAEPHLAPGPGGPVLSWLEPQGEAHALRYSVLSGDRWSPARTVAASADWFVNWADFPSVVPLEGELWAAHWLAKRPGGTYAYDVVVALSRDGGATWGEPLSPHTDGTRTEHGFVSLFPSDGGAGVIWLDGRNMNEDGAGNGHAGDAAGAGGMTLRAAVLAADGSRRAERLVDGLVCDCCQTDVALAQGVPVAVYRNRTEDEIRDIYYVRSEATGWGEPAPVADDGWRIAGCPVNGPAIAASGAEVAVAWFTAAGDAPRVRFARSVDGGRSFGEAVDIDAGAPFGRVDVELLGQGRSVVSWLRPGDDAAELCLRVVTADGRQGPVRVAARTSASRMSGFPQMLRDGERLVLAWTDAAGERLRVRTATVALAALQE